MKHCAHGMNKSSWRDPKTPIHLEYIKGLVEQRLLEIHRRKEIGWNKEYAPPFNGLRWFLVRLRLMQLLIRDNDDNFDSRKCLKSCAFQNRELLSLIINSIHGSASFPTRAITGKQTCGRCGDSIKAGERAKILPCNGGSDPHLSEGHWIHRRCAGWIDTYHSCPQCGTIVL